MEGWIVEIGKGQARECYAVAAARSATSEVKRTATKVAKRAMSKSKRKVATSKRQAAAKNEDCKKSGAEGRLSR